ncbi:MAG: hypothetical protein V3T70_07130 [Phycisphaerae bacterium]
MIRRSHATVMLLLVILLFPTGCDRLPKRHIAGGSLRKGPGPSEVVTLINSARVSGHFRELSRHVAADGAGAHVPVLLAVDQVLASNRALQQDAGKRFGRAAVSSLDLSSIGNLYGVLSLDVKVILEDISGDRGHVMIQEGDNVPLIEVPVEWRKGRWLAFLERPEAGLADRLNDLASELDGVRRRSLDSQRCLADLQREFRYRVWPLIQEIADGA